MSKKKTGCYDRYNTRTFRKYLKKRGIKLEEKVTRRVLSTIGVFKAKSFKEGFVK